MEILQDAQNELKKQAPHISGPTICVWQVGQMFSASHSAASLWMYGSYVVEESEANCRMLVEPDGSVCCVSLSDLGQMAELLIWARLAEGFVLFI